MDCQEFALSPFEDGEHCLDPVALGRLEQSFRDWADASPRKDVRRSRRRVLLIFLLIRYTGARLNEVLALDPGADIDCEERAVRFGAAATDRQDNSRSVQISEPLAAEIRSTLDDGEFRAMLGNRFGVDPAFVRRKFYERAEACGFAKHLGGPEMVRRARAVEMLQAKMPLAAVEKMFGSAMPQRAAAHICFSPEEIAEATRRYVEREGSRKTSARNIFFGKITSIRRGDIQARVTLVTVAGQEVSTIITNDSLERLGLMAGGLISAEVKAPWVVLYRGEKEPVCSAENRFFGVVERVVRGKINTECGVRIAGGSELCALVSSESGRGAAIGKGERVWAVFNGFAVILHAD